jgi:hypothetical protein
MKDQAIKAFEGAGKARKLHLTDSVFLFQTCHHFFSLTFNLLHKYFFPLNFNLTTLVVFNSCTSHPSTTFLFTVDIRDKKFIFMDSLYDKDSDLHQEVDNRMVNIQCFYYSCLLLVFSSKYKWLYLMVICKYIYLWVMWQIMNFERTWSECHLKNINFQEFEVIYPPVPKQNNGYVLLNFYFSFHLLHFCMWL